MLKFHSVSIFFMSTRKIDSMNAHKIKIPTESISKNPNRSKITIKMTALVQSPFQETKRVEFSAMHFGPCSEDCRSEETCSFASTSTASTSSNLTGWGSAISRKSYACLSSLDDTVPTQTMPRRVRSSMPSNGPTWGYFVDTVE